MVDQLTPKPADAKDYRAPVQGSLRRIGTLVPVTEVGPSGSKVGTTLKFIRHEEGAVQKTEAGLGGAGQGASGFGEVRPIVAESFHQTPQVTVFEAPLGEQRI